MEEQTTAAVQITTAANDMRRQSEQVAKAMGEQSRAARDMTTAAQSISKEIRLITQSNRKHLTSAEQVLGTLNDIRQITERNALGVKTTLSGTTDLIARAQQLAELVGGNGAGGNGRTARRKKSRVPDEAAAAGETESPAGSNE